MIDESVLEALVNEITVLTITVDGQDLDVKVTRDWTRVDRATIEHQNKKLVRQLIIQYHPIETAGDDFVGFVVGYTSNNLPVYGAKRVGSFVFVAEANDVPGEQDGRKVARAILEYVRPRLFRGTIWGIALQAVGASIYPSGGPILDVSSVIQMRQLYMYRMQISVRDTYIWHTVTTDEVAPLVADATIDARGSEDDEFYEYRKVSDVGD